MRDKDAANAVLPDYNSGVVPKLRFPEFRESDAWKRASIGTIAEVLLGYGFPEIHQGKTEGEFPFYKVSDISASIQEGLSHIVKAANYINARTLRELRAKVVPPGTTIFARIGEAIHANRRVITSASCVIDNNVAGIKRIDGKAVDLFVYYLLSTINFDEYSGGVVPSVNKSVIENIPVLCPGLLEQQRIAACLSSIDELIVAESRELSALKAHKKRLCSSSSFPPKAKPPRPPLP